jgi:hypothetical protein
MEEKCGQRATLRKLKVRSLVGMGVKWHREVKGGGLMVHSLTNRRR